MGNYKLSITHYYPLQIASTSVWVRPVACAIFSRESPNCRRFLPFQALFGVNPLSVPYQNFLPVVLLCQYHNHTHLLTMFITSSLLQIGGISALSHRQNYTSLYSFDCEFRIQAKLTTG